MTDEEPTASDPVDAGAKRTPVTIVTGGWGSGKSALVARLIAETPGPTAVIGPATMPDGLGAEWLVRIDEEVAVGHEDSLTCATREDLVRVVGTLARLKQPPTRIYVELDGSADPTLAVQTFLAHALLRRLVFVDAVVATIDPLQAVTRLSTSGVLVHDGILLEQLAIADVIVAHRLDRLTDRGCDTVGWSLRATNPRGRLALGLDGGREARCILGTHSFVVERAEQHLPRTAVPPRPVWGSDETDPITTMAVTIDGSLDLPRFESWIDQFHEESGAHLLRLHGVVAVDGEVNRWLVQGVRTTLELADGAPWDTCPRRTRLQLVGRHLDEATITRSIERCRSE